MNQGTVHLGSNHRDQWLAVLDRHGVPRPKALHVTEVPGALVQATLRERVPVGGEGEAVRQD